MATNLIQRLRTCSVEERRSVTMELVKIGSDEIIAELIRMVEGRHRKGLKWYNLNDQLIGVEALGKTGNHKALDFLKTVYTSKVAGSEIIKYAYDDGSKPGDEDYQDTVTEYSFPNTRGELAKQLYYREIKESNIDYGDLDVSTYKNDRVHNVFKKAIESLESALK